MRKVEEKSEKNIRGRFIRNLEQEDFALNVKKCIEIAFLIALGKVL